VDIKRPVTGRWLLRVLSKKELERKLPTKGTLVGNLIDEFRFG
jgi:hypothetical protein